MLLFGELCDLPSPHPGDHHTLCLCVCVVCLIPQPALLYLVPACLLFSLGCAPFCGGFSALFAYTEEEPPKDAPVANAAAADGAPAVDAPDAAVPVPATAGTETQAQAPSAGKATAPKQVKQAKQEPEPEQQMPEVAAGNDVSATESPMAGAIGTRRRRRAD